MKICVIGCLLCSMLSGQILYEEYFTDGGMQLDWHPWFETGGIGDSMRVLSDPTTPGGDGWAGVISNEVMGVAGLTYAGDPGLEDYSIEAWIYTVVSTAAGPYNGIAMRMQADSGFYYRLVADFDDDQRIRLGMFTGGMFPIVIRDWSSVEIPGGVPATSSWHKFKLVIVEDSIWAYYDDVLLPDCPFIDNTIQKGYFGVYVFNMAATDSTVCDNIIVRAEPTGVAELGHEAPSLLTVQPNPFTHETDIKWQITDNRQEVVLKVYDISGRLVRNLFGLSSVTGHQLSVRWDGRDAAGKVLAPGVYFIQDEHGEHLGKVVKLH
ncbi:hypothetical protein AMJ83_03605 [candidate division WOR_3 bacterium SM23_42]|uniref:FlgD/Vpr Ig-like domain-containing protein n=1 Tax=candidate division WOR_3 bacterium SM23_42 TaxID=1703779 RepID=A0A0S8FUX9_UNCW3|nr:MAG: hypothetical protein AMJ83_03605 [candidate division WOR_3 bacterium SM23_42]